MTIERREDDSWQTIISFAVVAAILALAIIRADLGTVQCSQRE